MGKLILPNTIIKKELTPLKQVFPLEAIIKAAQKTKDGLSVQLPGAPKGIRFFKAYLTSKQGPGRCLFMMQNKEGHIVPLLLRTKNDRIGENMSPNNTFFIDAIEKNISLVKADFQKKRYEVIEI